MTFPRARRDAAVRTGAALALWAGLVLPAFWWASDGGLQDLLHWGTALMSLGRLTGLVASVLLLTQVVLMARVPLLERAFGQDKLAHKHRWIGFTSFNLMVTHIVLITWGYAGGTLPGVPSRFWDLTVNYPGMLLALAGTLAIVGVTVTSIRLARRRLRYESWHLLHLYAYLGVGLALPHQLWTGQQFTTSPGRTVFWWTAWGVAAGSVLLWRVLLPIGRNLWHGLRVSHVVHEGDGTHSVHVTGRRLHRLPVEAGQFFHWRFWHGEGRSRAHPYSLSAAPDGRGLRLSVKGIGDDSAALAGVRPGTRVLVEGPFGRLSDRARTREKVLLIGAGVGITPLRALAEGLDYAYGDATLLYRFHDRALFHDELAELSRSRGLRTVLLPGSRRHPESWLPRTVTTRTDSAALLRWVPDLPEHDVYVCGPTPWADAVRRSCLAAGLPPEQFHHEAFSW